MKTIAVTINLELEVPNDWELVQTSDGIDVLSIGDGRFLDLTFEPMVSTDMEGTWSNEVGEEFMNDLLDMVVSEDVTYEMTVPPAH